MNEPLRIFCVNLQRYVDIEGGESLGDIARRLGRELSQVPVCAFVNNCNQDLRFPVYAPKQVEFFDVASAPGQRVVRTSLVFMLYKALHDVLPGMRLKVEHSISHGLFCRIMNSEGEALVADAATVELIRGRMEAIAAADMPILRHEKLTAEVLEKFRDQNMPDKIRLLDTLHNLYTVYYSLDGVCDSYLSPLVPSTGHLRVFGLEPYHDGMLLLGPDPQNPQQPSRPVEQPKMFAAFTETLRFDRVIKAGDVGLLNQAVQRRDTAMLINVAEALHSKRLGVIAQSIAQRGSRIVLIAGPSSSGKTTTAKRLGIPLMTNMLTPKMISLDDYFVDREKTPRDEKGEYDYEALEAIDLEQFNDHLKRLERGESVDIPRYDFISGTRQWHDNPLQLDERSVLIVEGIHGLNPALTPGVPESRKFKIYVSCFTSVALDNVSRIATSDNRLLRRLTRDYRTRGNDALSTLARWESVRRGEEKHIFPYQENADVMFNSSLFYEISVLRRFAEPILREVPDTVPEYGEAKRMLKFLDNFIPISPEEIPPTSLLREFIGGSSFKY